MGNQNSNVRYSIHQALVHLHRHRGTTICAVVSICLALLITGMFAVGSISLNSMLDNVEKSIVVRAFVDDGATQEDLDAFKKDVEGWDGIESVTFVTKDEALENYKANMGAQSTQEAIDALNGENPLPASFKIIPENPDTAADLAKKVQESESFKKVSDGGAEQAPNNVLYGKETVDRLLAVTNMIGTGAIAAIAVLTLISFTFINNTIRMSVAVRDKEIRIMRLVGASNGFIRGPFIAEGIFQALIGSLIAVGALELVRRFLLPDIAEALPFMRFDVPLPMYFAIYGSMALVGILVGVASSLIAIRRFLSE